jgi:hypothetical protein
LARRRANLTRFDLETELHHSGGGFRQGAKAPRRKGR